MRFKGIKSMNKIHKALHWVVIFSMASHIFCCVLPTIVSMVGLVAALGFLSSYLPVLDFLHEELHIYEIPIVIGSGLILALGWGAHYVSEHMDCHDTGCHHGSCQPQKKRVTKILLLATSLFLFNSLMVVFVG
jgi:hypothetical protein